ncbi:MAG: 30S ribosomal protein S6 [Lachnoclostridium sp.]|nr:30S ribosomal protein S6 [Lachnoclostridium sp.]
MKEAVEKFEKVVTDNGATIANVEMWGLRKLAYPIQKKSTGFYTLVEFDATPDTVKKLETAFRRDERVLRFLVFRKDKYAEEYAQKRRQNSAKAAVETTTTETVETKED